MKMTQKRTSLAQKAAYILKPFLIYMVVKTAAMLVLAMLIPALPIAGMGKWVEQNAHQLSAVVNAAASLIAAGFLVRDLLKEVAVYDEIDIDAGMPRQLLGFIRSGLFGYGRVRPRVFACSALSGILSAFLLNRMILFAMGAFQSGSARYDQVETIQYSVPVWMGLLLYGLISPLVEEMVFRGVIYNRMKRFYSIPRSILLTALMFGAFHANLPQFAYGTCMGLLIAFCYEKAGCLGAPVLFHMAANISVFLCAAA